MACIKDFDPKLLGETPCKTFNNPWSTEGVVTWIDKDNGLNRFNFKLDGQLISTYKVPIPIGVELGSTLRVSFDGEKSRVELVKKG